jgi:hypothetical protein
MDQLREAGCIYNLSTLTHLARQKTDGLVIHMAFMLAGIASR